MDDVFVVLDTDDVDDVDDVDDEINEIDLASEKLRAKMKAERRRFAKEKVNKKKMIKTKYLPMSVNYGIAHEKVDGEYVETNHLCYESSSRRKRFLKQKCNRVVRHTKSIPVEKAGYKKVSEYWWILD